MTLFSFRLDAPGYAPLVVRLEESSTGYAFRADRSDDLPAPVWYAVTQLRPEDIRTMDRALEIAADIHVMCSGSEVVNV